MNLRGTVDALATLGFDHAVLPSGSKGAVLVSSDSDRRLGLWPNGRAENALWTDPGTGMQPSVDPGRYVRLGDRDGCRREDRGDAWAARADTPLVTEPIGSFAVEAGCAVVHAGGPRRTLAFGGADARSRIFHMADLGAGRSLLLVKECEGQEPADLACTKGGDGPCTELGLDSPAIGSATGRQRLVWRQTLHAVLGRTVEIRALLRRITSR